MRLTITTADGAVYKDGVMFAGLILSGIPANVTALQWDGVSGWIEFANESEFRRPANEIIDVLPDWANDALLKWEEASAAYIEAQSQAAALSQAEVSGAQTL